MKRPALKLAAARTFPIEQPAIVPLRALVNVACLDGRQYVEKVGTVVGRSIAGIPDYSVQWEKGGTENGIVRNRILVVGLPT